MLTRDRVAIMRTSEAERQRVADFLRDCCGEGRLSPDELEERLDRLFAGGTVADLRRLVDDLPGGEAVLPRYGAPAVWRAPAEVAPPRLFPRGLLPLLALGVATVIFMALPLLVKALTAGIVVALLVVGLALTIAIAPAVLALWGLAWVASRLARARSLRP